MSHASRSFITILSPGSIPPVVQIMTTKVLDYMPDHAHLAEDTERFVLLMLYSYIESMTHFNLQAHCQYRFLI